MKSEDILGAVRQLIEDKKELKDWLYDNFDEISAFSAVGRLAIYFNLLDQGLLWLTITLLGFRIPNIGMELLKTWTVDQKVVAAKKAILHYRSLTVFQNEEAQEAQAVLEETSAISKERNKWIHGVLSTSDNEASRLLTHPKWKEALTLEWTEIAPLIERIMKSSGRLNNFSDLAEERLGVLYEGLRHIENQSAAPLD